MTLPRVKIYFDNGALGTVEASADGVCALLCNGEAIADKLTLGQVYLITSMTDLADIGINEFDSGANGHIYKTVSEFYAEAGEGFNLYLMVTPIATTMAQMTDQAGSYAPVLIRSAKGDINLLMVTRYGTAVTVVDGLDSDVFAAAEKAQQLGEWAANTLFAPLTTFIEGRGYSGSAIALRDLSGGSWNRVAIVIGDTATNSVNSAIGLVCGRAASIPVQRSLARVKDGAVAATELFLGNKAAENGNPDVVHDRGYITFRTFVGKAGYYFTDDKLCVGVSDDYALLPRRRVIDKAYRIAYQTLVTELSDELPVTSDGYIPASTVKSIQNKVEAAIENSMTANGNLGNDPADSNDTGVECYIDHKQNVVATSQLKAKLRVKPFGYAKYIDLYLGFKTSTT